MRICEVGIHQAKGGVACADHGDGTVDRLRAIAVREMTAGAKRFEGRKHVGKEGRSRSLEIDEQSQGLLGDRIEHAVLAYIAIRVELGGRVLLFEDLNERIDVKTSQSPIGGETRERVTYVELLAEKPNISLDADTACLYGRV